VPALKIMAHCHTRQVSAVKAHFATELRYTRRAKVPYAAN